MHTHTRGQVPTASVRTLSTADERREDVLRAAMKVVGPRGLYGTSTMDVAAAAGISQAYLFRLFPTKTELFVAVLGEEFSADSGHDGRGGGECSGWGRPVRDRDGRGVHGLLQDPEVLLTQLQGQAAASEPAVRDVVAAWFPDALRDGGARMACFTGGDSGVLRSRDALQRDRGDADRRPATSGGLRFSPPTTKRGWSSLFLPDK